MALMVAAGSCGRIGYEPVIGERQDGGALEGGVAADGRASTDAQSVDAASVPADATPGQADATPGQADAPVPSADGTVSPDLANPPDAPSPPDVANPPDGAPDGPPDAPVDLARTDGPPGAGACLRDPGFDIFADFEDGTVKSNQVGDRGGTPFTLIGQTPGTLLNQAQSNCGQRVLELAPIGQPGAALLVQSRFSPRNGDGTNQWFDARGYQGMVFVMRASTPVIVRLKLPNDDTISDGYDHFQISLNVGAQWSSSAIAWGAFRQAGAGNATQFPTFDISRLFGIEISASLPAGARLWIDEIALIR